jgi:hypothetical protein
MRILSIADPTEMKDAIEATIGSAKRRESFASDDRKMTTILRLFGCRYPAKTAVPKWRA